MSRNRLIILGIAVLTIVFLPGLAKLCQLRAKNNSLIKQIESLKTENKKLAQEIYKLQKDPVYTEQKAREKIGLSQKGEIIYKVRENQAQNR